MGGCFGVFFFVFFFFSFFFVVVVGGVKDVVGCFE